MKYRQIGTTDLNVSEVGFGVWTVSTNWWGKIEEQQGISLMTSASPREKWEPFAAE